MGKFVVGERQGTNKNNTKRRMVRGILAAEQQGLVSRCASTQVYICRVSLPELGV